VGRGTDQRVDGSRIGKRELLRDLARGEARRGEVDSAILFRYARAAYLHAGGDPADLNDLPWSTIMDWLVINDVLDARASLGGVPER